jgi:hypothetical protein
MTMVTQQTQVEQLRDPAQVVVSREVWAVNADTGENVKLPFGYQLVITAIADLGKTVWSVVEDRDTAEFLVAF